MDANELKQYIIDNNKISLVLEKVGCHGIKEYNTEYRAALPNKTNTTAVTVKKENLFTAINSSDVNAMGDIFVLIMKLQDVSFGKANKIMHQYLGLNYKYEKKKVEEKQDILDVFKKVKKTRCIVNKDIEVYDESILKEYVNLPHISWVREGIMPFACKRFNIGYSYDKKRIIIPWRYWCGEDENKFVGVIGRTTIPNYEQFDIPKYFGIKPFSKGLDLYGLYENYQSIQEKGYVTIFESEKSVLKRYSRKDETSVAVGCHSISEEQVKILIGLNVDIVIVFDKDVELNEIRKECEKFYGIRNVYYVYDKWNILNEKESPADKPNKQYEFMLKYKIMYDDKEHKELNKWEQEKRKKS